MDKQPLVSVLTPVYNGEKYLAQCIDSVIAQRYNHWEYVIVNNQSTDRSLEIAKKYARNDDRIRIHNNKEHLPVLQNLNHAFRQISAESKYCKVVHADDWLFPECIPKMVEVMEEYKSVGIVSAYRLEGNNVDLDGLPYPSNFNSGKEIARKYLLHGTSYFGSPTSLLIRSNLIRERENVYDESYLRADSAACLDLLKESEFGFVHQVLTFTRRHEMSTTNRVARNNYAFIHGELKFQLDYGPFYLTEQEYKNRLSNRINVYYILLARNLVQKKSIAEFKRQLQILETLAIKLKVGKFLKYFIRELFLQLFKIFGIDFKKIS